MDKYLTLIRDFLSQKPEAHQIAFGLALFFVGFFVFTFIIKRKG